MALGIGLISALIIAKKSSKKTRLQKLQERLNHRKKNSLVLYQIPVKKIFILFFITLFIIFLNYIFEMHIEELLKVPTSTLTLSSNQN